MKKAFKIILFTLLLGGILTYVFCLGFYREPTLEFTYKAVEFLNKPLPIVGVSIVLLGVLILSIIQKSSWGKEQIKKTKEIADLTEEKVKSEINKLETEKQALNEHLDTEIDKLTKENELLKEFIVKLCQTMPNKKIQELAKELSYEERENTKTTEE